MASAPALDYSRYTSIRTLPGGYGTTYDSLSRSSRDYHIPRSTASLDALYASEDAAAQYYSPRKSSDTTQSSPRKSSRSSSSQSLRPVTSATHAKLHKRKQPRPPSSSASTYNNAASHVSFSRTRKGSAPAVPDSPITPSLSTASSYETFSGQSHRSVTRDRFKNNLRIFAAQKEEDEQTLDLSQTAAENSERLGLEIHGSSNNTLPFIVGSHEPDFGSHHSRSISHSSVISNGSGSFKPSTPFMYPMAQPALTYSPPQVHPYPPQRMDSYSASLESGIDHFGCEGHNSVMSTHEEEPGLDEVDDEDTIAASMAETVSQVPTESGIPSARPSLQLNTSRSSSKLQQHISTTPPDLASSTTTTTATSESRRSYFGSSQSDLDLRFRTLSRKSTDRSTDMTSPRSVSSAFNFRPQSREGNYDPVQRAASIAAARRAFAEREEAKDRKYQDRKRKAEQKHARKRSSLDSRKACSGSRSSREGSMSARGSNSGERSRNGSRTAKPDFDGAQEGGDGDCEAADAGSLAVYSREYADLTPVQSHALPTHTDSLPPEEADLGDEEHEFDEDDEEEHDAASHSTRSRKNRRRSAKGLYVGSFLWLKTRMLHLGKD